MTGARRRRIRGSALTEMALCLLPYGLVLLGITLFFQLSLGGQEAHKAMAWYASDPDALGEAGIRQRFFLRDGGALDVAGKRSNQNPDPAQLTEEPVLPYGKSLSAANNDLDLAVAIQRSFSYHIGSTGTVGISDPRSVALWTYYLGVADAKDYQNLRGSRTRIDPSDPDKITLPTLALSSVGETLLTETAALLGSELYGPRDKRALSYDWAAIRSYTGGLPVLGIGGQRLPLESNEDNADRFRQSFVLTGGHGEDGEATGIGSPGAYLAEMETVAWNAAGVRGTRYAGRPASRTSEIVDFVARGQYPWNYPQGVIYEPTERQTDPLASLGGTPEEEEEEEEPQP